jgi:hypothetical protein
MCASVNTVMDFGFRKNQWISWLSLYHLSKNKPNSLTSVLLRYKCVYRFCGLVARVPGYRSRGPGSIPGVTRYFEKWWVWSGVHSASWVQLRSYLEEQVVSVYKIENTAVGMRWPRNTLYPQKLVLTSSTSGGRSVGIIRSRTKAMEFF